jgi:hypothetical protein
MKKINVAFPNNLTPLNLPEGETLDSILINISALLPSFGELVPIHREVGGGQNDGNLKYNIILFSLLIAIYRLKKQINLV